MIAYKLYLDKPDFYKTEGAYNRAGHKGKPGSGWRGAGVRFRFSTKGQEREGPGAETLPSLAEQAGSLGEQGGKAEATGPLSARGDAPLCISTALLLSFLLSLSNSPSGSSNATLTFYRRQDQGSQAISPRSNSNNAKPGTLASEPPPTSTTLRRRCLKDAQHSLTESLLDRKKTRQWGFISFDP